jgi:integrase
MASISRRGVGQFRARVRRNGHPPLTRTFKSRAAAEAWARDQEAAMDRGHWTDSREAERTTLAEAVDRYAREVSALKRGARQETARIARWKAHALAARPLASIRGADLAAWRDARLEAVGANTVRLELAVLSHLFTIARKEWGLESLGNPARNVRLPPMPPGMDRRLSREEEEAVLAQCSPVLRAAVIVAVESAMRRGELASLRRDAIAGAVARLGRTKNGHARDVPLSPRALEALAQLPARLDGYVFGPPKAAAEAFTHGFQDAARAAGVHGATFHTLRHEATSRLFERGLSIVEVAAITGHRTLAMLRRYTHLRAEDLAAKLAA